MNETKPDWYSVAVRDDIAKGKFNEHSMQAVIDRINRPRRRISLLFRNRVVTFGSLTAVVLLLAIWVGLNGDLLWSERGVDRSGASAPPPEDVTLLDYSNVQYYGEGEIIRKEDRMTNPSIMHEPRSIELVDMSSVQIEDVYPAQGVGTVYHFYFKSELEDPKRYPKTGFVLDDIETPGQLFYFGTLMWDPQLTRERAFGEEGYLLQVNCGPTFKVCSFWFTPDSEGGLNSHASFEGPMYIADLDRDGEEEIVVATTDYYKKHVFIYKKMGDRIMYVDVNKALDASDYDERVYYEPSRQIFQMSSGEGIRNYRYAEGRNQFIRLHD
ncbi:hypothetical protein [Paenibacillus sp. NPDC058071]|uniref:hypothetical protein n=1 Tax=Paenibacillus sp. NPDC058071 TaxID=3346326 RepID=UPI0036DB3EDF